MKTFYVDFSGYCTIKANNEEEAREKFYYLVGEGVTLPKNYYEITGVEQNEEECG